MKRIFDAHIMDFINHLLSVGERGTVKWVGKGWQVRGIRAKVNDGVEDRVARTVRQGWVGAGGLW